MSRSLKPSLSESFSSISPSRIERVSVFDATPENVHAMSWSEHGPPVRPVQPLLAVEVAWRGTRATGVAAATRYLPEGHASTDARAAHRELDRYVGKDVVSLNVDRHQRDNPYEPNEHSLHALLELAALDALGLLIGLPASIFLGGICRSQLPVYASLPSFSEPADAIACARAAISDGFRAIKFHASGDVDDDLETIRCSRSELDARLHLMWDGSCAYDLYGALAVGAALATADFLWFEAPMRDDAGYVLAELSRRLAIPLVPDANACVRSIGEWGRDAVQGVWGAFRVDITRAPSVTDALRVVCLAEALGLPCEIQSFGYPLAQYANLALMATTRSCRFFESPYPATDLDDGGLVQAPNLVDGMVMIPQQPGLGHSLDLDRLTAKCTLVAESGI